MTQDQRTSGQRDDSLVAPVATEAGWTDVDLRAVDTARVLAADAVQKTGNGHPGTAMSLAPVAYLLYHDLMRYDPADPSWIGRDRFILSCGHSSLTQYVQLYFAGIDMELADLQALRTWGSKTPGHPEYSHTKGVDITTGPLGSGLASAVGMAMSQRRQRGLLDPDAAPGTSPFDHHIYVIASDGDIMEGVSSEASSLAGHQELGNLTLIYDENYISIEDDTNVSFSEDVAKRYEAYGWDVRVVDWRETADGNGAGYTEDVDALLAAIEAGKQVTDKPSIVVLRTIIGWPAPNKMDTGSAHGAALGDEEVAAIKQLLGFDTEATFEVDEEVIDYTRRTAAERGTQVHEEWEKRFLDWKQTNPEGAALLERVLAKKLPADLDAALPVFEAGEKLATRAASGKVLAALAPVLPELWGGSADLAGSNNTTMKGEPSFVPESRQTDSWQGGPYGRTLHFGIRENAMGMILNGIALEGLTRPYGGTFLVFSDYMRPAVRLAAIQELPVIFVWTHDSIGVGEDGPTHQPIEHVASLRAIPGFDVVRPADANETAIAWRTILQNHDTPAGLMLTRQGVTVIDREEYASAEGVANGAYVLADADGSLDLILIATGSEVSIALDARKTLQEKGIGTRVVSMPCREWFAAQPEEYQKQVLPGEVRARVSVEAATAFGWHDLVGDAGRTVAIDHFGASADGALLFEKFGFTSDAVVAAAEDSLRSAGDAGAPSSLPRPAEGTPADI